MELRENIKLRRRQRKMTLDDVAEIVGVSKQTVQKYESGVISNIPSEKIELLAKALGTTPALLMGWQQSREGDLDAYLGLFRVRRKTVRMLGDVAAGQPIFADEAYDAIAACDEDLDCDFALRVKGDSMSPRLLDGDVVFIRSQPDVLDGQVAVVLVDDSATLKHVYHIPGGIQLVSDNPDYAPMIYNRKNCDTVKIIGLAVSYQRRLSVK